jgi:hypothetical protein
LTAPHIYGEREFQEWRDIGGATLSNNPTLTVSMAQHQTVLPVYMATESGLPSLNQLSVAVNGNGTVTSTPSGIDCGSVCEAEFDADTPVTLTATPASGSTFTGWSGACSGMDRLWDDSESISAPISRFTKMISGTRPPPD